ncbi:MAG: NF038129 family PEP-CTERM protein [Dissulfurispiraceae bacterium]|jgi:hypothetical protein
MKLLNIKLLVIAIIMFAATSAFADLSYNFSVNTSSVSGQQGYIDMQYNPGISSTGAGSASTVNFISDASLGTIQLTGGATGALPSVVINNTTGYNDYFQALTFGNTLNFTLNLSGAAGNSFYLAFLDPTQSIPLLTTDSTNGYATIIDMNSNGAAVTNLSSQVSVNATPIPAAAWLLGSGLMGLVGIRRKMQN